MDTQRGDKPLGRKAYGSIGHIRGSRLGPGDHMVHEGQSAMCTTKAPRDKTVWVQAKLDGSCVSAALLDDGSLVALGRAGYLAETSPHEMHHMWARWVQANEDRFREVLQPGERIVGEWLAQAHGTIYDLTGREPFVAFDIMRADKRLTVMELEDRLYGREEVSRRGFEMPDRLITAGPCGPVEAMQKLDHYGADKPEGVVYRVETYRRGEPTVDFLAKWVRPDKIDGHYLDGEPIWNWDAQQIRSVTDETAATTDPARQDPVPAGPTWPPGADHELRDGQWVPIDGWVEK